ncbi:Uncharacterised protein [uncultured archaeon]|nr:Uncharacterised protein [uncultured archaeon]
MKFESISIKQAITDIEKGKIFLPPIQRNFVWNYDRIVNLFDSLYRHYPIGNCIFWKLKPETSQDYPLYKFIKEYSENKSKTISNENVPSNLLEQDVYAVVDGQQRLSSLYIGLAGTYKYKKSGKGLQNVDANFVTSKLYINLLAIEAKAFDEEVLFEFWVENDIPMNDKNLWFEVGKVMKWKNSEQSEKVVKEILLPKILSSNKKTLIDRFELRKEKIISKLRTIYDMLNDNRLYYFDIDNQNLDEVVDIFTRVNSGGMTLKKSDLLFSILVAQWNEGRDEIKELIESMKESGVSISQDFIMRTCLVLSDLPIKYKLESFTSKNISIIKKNWEDIKSCLMKLCDLLPEIGYNDYLNQSDNSLIPIAYYIKKGGSYNTQKSKKDLQKYYVVSQVRGIFGGQSDQTLEKIRTEIRKQLEKDKTLNYQNLIGLKLPGGKTFELTLPDLQELVGDTTYFSPHAYFLLSLIYPTVDLKIRRYEVDHVLPKSKFNYSNLRNNGIDDEEIMKYWIEEKKDLLPNLQLLGDKDNSNKRAKTIIEYLKAKPPRERKEFIKDNLLPSDYKLLELKNFDDFFEYRKRQLVTKLKKHFGL